jgi:hypothetical protein
MVAVAVGGGGSDQPAVLGTAAAPTGPDTSAILLGFAVVAVGAAGGWIIFEAVDPGDFKPGSNYAVYAGLFVLAQAVERLLEPFSGWYQPTAAKETESNEKKQEAIRRGCRGRPRRRRTSRFVFCCRRSNRCAEEEEPIRVLLGTGIRSVDVGRRRTRPLLDAIRS